jgi:CII-binding regulator of phage lambda lysogenization HflD
MSRRKKSTSHIEQAVTRLAALKSIDTKMDLGNGLDVPKYETAIKDLQTKLGDYNTMLSLVDEKLNMVQTSEKTLLDLSERMLAGVASKFGKNSDEYEKAGGKKKSERKRPARKAKAA